VNRLVALCLCATALGCNFDGGVPFFGDDSPRPDAGPTPTVDGAPGTDAPPAPSGDIAHLPPSEWSGGNDDLILGEGDEVEIDTTALSILGDVTVGSVVTASQVGPGPEVAILRIDAMTLAPTSTLTVYGSRPLIIIAGGAVQIHGLVNASALYSRPGPGGSVAGPGAGEQGEHKSFRDGGGGGGGFGSNGANGGDATTLAGSDAQGGAGGPAYLDNVLTVLTGGSGGGKDGLDCSYAPGAGGGAFQLFSFVSIDVFADGAINAGGGGGGPGRECPAGNDSSLGGGTGGGSGGAIDLQAPTIAVLGRLAANGGGGGGGAGEDGEGGFGQNGRITGPASGGIPGGLEASTGGSGGFGNEEPSPGFEEFSGVGNAGGGGGGAGRIVVRTKPDGLTLDAERSSPHAKVLVY